MSIRASGSSYQLKRNAFVPRYEPWTETVAKLRASEIVSDGAWDRVYPWQHAEESPVCWTPVAVARRAAELLTETVTKPVLDVGSGVGKFCVVAALTTPGVFVGVECHRDLVEVARSTARRAGATHASFVCGRMEDVDWADFGGFYFFNPLEVDWLASSGEQARQRQRMVSWIEQRLALMAAGTRVVTYHGFGGTMPGGYRLVRREPIGSDAIECWDRVS
jgi:Methyltransferase domain